MKLYDRNKIAYPNLNNEEKILLNDFISFESQVLAQEKKLLESKLSIIEIKN
jgi:hypothetical protein